MQSTPSVLEGGSVAWWVDAPDRHNWLGPFEDQAEAIEQCQTWFPNSTVRWVEDDATLA